MKQSRMEWSVQKFEQELKKGAISFDYPIQRAGGQWDNLAKSLLIHSLAEEFPVPALYMIGEEEEIINPKTNKAKKMLVYKVLDGKQRMTNIKSFLLNEYTLHEDTPPVVIDDEKYDVAGKIFDELNEEVRNAILGYNLYFIKLENATDEQIEEVFIRLNNGVSLTKQQKAKGKMGKEWAGLIKEMIEHPLMKEKASFTELQLKRADDELSIIQTMAILDKDYELQSISSNDMYSYVDGFRGSEDKKELAKEILSILDYLDKAIKEKEKVLLKKIHFPMVVVTAKQAIDNNVDPIRFGDWMEEFKLSLKNKSDIHTKYKSFGGAGSVKKVKTMGRIDEMQKHLQAYIKFTPKNMDELIVEDKKEDKKEPVKDSKPEVKEEKKKPEVKKDSKPEVKNDKKPQTPKADKHKEALNEEAKKGTEETAATK